VIGSLTRVVLLVRDFEASVRFYRDVLGLELAGPPRENWAAFQAGAAGAMICLHGPWQGMQFDIDDFGRSPDELLFRVDDVDRVRSELLSRGVDISEPHEPGPGIRVAEFRDPDGRRLAIEGPAKSAGSRG
jgi:catechol 2,3-dioxygenase-like lactoylglutathione lyase family enzyme